MESTTEPKPVELIGVYHADRGMLGELRYVVGKVIGTTHCALCDITHGNIRRKTEWDESCRRFDIPIRLIHLNERDSREIAACTDGTPTVLARWTDGTLTPVLAPADLELDGSVTAFFDLLNKTLAASS